MHILFLCQVVPYPPDAGPKVKTWQVLRYLISRGDEVSLACFVRPEEEAYLPELRKHFAHVYPVPMRRSRLADLAYGLRSLFTGRPFLIERDDRTAMRALVNRLVETGQVDVIHADQVSMAQFAMTGWKRLHRHPYLIFDAHNAVWTIFERVRQYMPLWLQPAIAFEARRMKRYEGRTITTFDHTLAVTEIDKKALLRAVDGAGELETASVTVIPIAVDASHLQPITRQADSTMLVTLGTLRYPPNADGIRWFAREVFPLIQRQVADTRLTIIGKDPPADFDKLAAQSGGVVTVTGYAPDLIPFLEQAALMVIPVRAGGGMRVRILEAFAWGMPVVTTTVGLEGIDAVPGRDVLVADQPEEFAACVVRLLQDPELRARLAENSRRLAENAYDWQVALKRLDAVYERFEHHPEVPLEIERSVEQTA